MSEEDAKALLESIQPDCSECFHFLMRKTDGVRKVGICRRFPPITVIHQDATTVLWPIVDDDDCCGEFQGAH